MEEMYEEMEDILAELGIGRNGGEETAVVPGSILSCRTFALTAGFGSTLAALPPEVHTLETGAYTIRNRSVTRSRSFFAGLPTEIRVRIWLFARPGPRIIPIQMTPGYTSGSARTYVCRAALRTTVQSPAVLSVNRESRQECITSYTPITNACAECLTSPRCDHTRGVMYVNLNIDTILIDESMLHNYHRPAFWNRDYNSDFIEKIKYLAVEDVFEGMWIGDEGPREKNGIRDFKGLEEIIVLVGGPPPSSNEETCLNFRKDIKQRLSKFMEKIRQEEDDLYPGNRKKIPSVKSSCFYLGWKKHEVIQKLGMAETEEEEVELAKANLKDWKPLEV